MSFKNISQLFAVKIIWLLLFTINQTAHATTTINSGEKIGSFYSTFYYVLNEKSYVPGTDAEIKDTVGNVLAKVSAKFKKELDIEGTGILLNGKTVNYANVINGEVRYKYTTSTWGMGVGDCVLTPYRTIAVDTREIPLGSTVFIPAVKGMKLPDGSIHDGIFKAEDIGNGIQGWHIDFFAKEGLSSASLYEGMGIFSRTWVDIYKVSPPNPNGCHTKDPNNERQEAAKSMGLKMMGLRQLADQHAASGNVTELEAALSSMQHYRMRWELYGRPYPTRKLTSKELNEISDELRSQVRMNYSHPLEANGSSLSTKQIVLTFDDGPHETHTRAVQKVLKELKLPATFFEVGDAIIKYPQITLGLAKDGFLIGNHSYNHVQMIKLIIEAARREIDITQNMIQTILGGAEEFNNYYQLFFHALFNIPRTLTAPEFFRAPYGSRDDRILKVITDTVVGTTTTNAHGASQNIPMKHIMWNVDSLDWHDLNPVTIEERVFSQLKLYNNRGVILFHDVHPQTVVALKSILPRMQKEGFTFLYPYHLFPAN
ncbi:MAG: polysaccharide deacetylase family protein [Oligoflexia bacterium]|nr:polysaccharide deacetylase family protein [Oligoflexia bacterium]